MVVVVAAVVKKVNVVVMVFLIIRLLELLILWVVLLVMNSYLLTRLRRWLDARHIELTAMDDTDWQLVVGTCTCTTWHSDGNVDRLVALLVLSSGT